MVTNHWFWLTFSSSRRYKQFNSIKPNIHNTTKNKWAKLQAIKALRRYSNSTSKPMLQHKTLILPHLFIINTMHKTLTAHCVYQFLRQVMNPKRGCKNSLCKAFILHRKNGYLLQPTTTIYTYFTNEIIPNHQIWPLDYRRINEKISYSVPTQKQHVPTT